jgi:signal-transduction protein with cAMP-binding, CBS, and nucleotidyltransferase domain
MVGLAVGSAAAPLLVTVLGAEGALLAAGGALVALAVLGWPRLRRIDAAAGGPARDFDLLVSLPIFTPLAQHVAERLAGHLVPVRVGAGGVVIREGDEGDRFYIVRDGHVAVTKGGRRVAELGPGDSVGEIALLRDVPRTATVTAIDDVDLLALEREVFLEAVTGSMPSRSAADEQVARRLSDR